MELIWEYRRQTEEVARSFGQRLDSRQELHFLEFCNEILKRERRGEEGGGQERGGRNVQNK